MSGASDGKVRCPWCAGSDLYTAYHDEEWGRPCRDDRKLFEFLVLEGAQAGLSWITILKRRAAYARAFDGFDPEAVARYDGERCAALLEDAGIVRNRAKIASAVNNAARFLEVREAFGSFSEYLWRFVDGTPLAGRLHIGDPVPAETDISRAMSRDLKRRGFTFVGPTICYAYMQAVGLVNDHYLECWLAPGAGAE
jgi:3-methyladenine DNA glycosylase